MGSSKWLRILSTVFLVWTGLSTSKRMDVVSVRVDRSFFSPIRQCATVSQKMIRKEKIPGLRQMEAVREKEVWKLVILKVRKKVRNLVMLWLIRNCHTCQQTMFSHRQERIRQSRPSIQPNIRVKKRNRMSSHFHQTKVRPQKQHPFPKKQLQN